MNNYTTISPLKQITILVALMVGAALLNFLFSFLALLPWGGVESLGNIMRQPALYIGPLKFLQITQSICLFFIPAYFYPKLTYQLKPKAFYCYKTPSQRSIIVITLSIIAAIPLINFLGSINAKMVLPPFMSNIEQWMKTSELRAAELTELLVSGDHIGHLLLNLLMIAILPAIGEELIFRGVIQKTLLQATRNKHLAIWLAAFIFSAFHLQFYGFLPRLFLGIILGYLYFASGSLWLAIMAHFTNNAVVTIAYYLQNKGLITENIDRIGTGEDWITAALSAGILLIIYFYLERNKTVLQLDEFK